MEGSLRDKHYEEKFEFPMWKFIEQRAEQKDISYVSASREVMSGYEKTIKYRDTEFEEVEVQKRAIDVTYPASFR